MAGGQDKPKTKHLSTVDDQIFGPAQSFEQPLLYWNDVHWRLNLLMPPGVSLFSRRDLCARYKKNCSREESQPYSGFCWQGEKFATRGVTRQAPENVHEWGLHNLSGHACKVRWYWTKRLAKEQTAGQHCLNCQHFAVEMALIASQPHAHTLGHTVGRRKTLPRPRNCEISSNNTR